MEKTHRFSLTKVVNMSMNDQSTIGFLLLQMVVVVEVRFFFFLSLIDRLSDGDCGIRIALR